MDHQELVDLANREIRLGVPDKDLMARAQQEAKGVEMHAHQIYWRLRSSAIREESIRPGASPLYLVDLKANLDALEKRRRFRSELRGWAWAGTCLISIASTYVFPRLALGAYAKGGAGPAFLGYGALGVGSLVLFIVSYTKCKHDARRPERIGRWLR